MDLLETARKEVEEEVKREKIEKLKIKIREDFKNKKWWHRYMPFKLSIKIERR